MIIVKSKEELKDDMFCSATEENFNILVSMGYKTGYSDFSEIAKNYLYDAVIDCFNIYGDSIIWCDSDDVYINSKFKFDIPAITKQQINNLKNYNFIEPTKFNVELIKIIQENNKIYYIGIINNSIPAKWNSDGECVIPGNTYDLYKNYKQRLYTKENLEGFFPAQKFRISWTENMSKGLEETGWTLATNEQIDSFKI